MPHIKKQRCLVPSGERGSFLLHVLIDAPGKIYGAAAYGRCAQTNGEITSNIVIAKSWVYPLKLTSIPELDLCYAVLGLKFMS